MVMSGQNQMLKMTRRDIIKNILQYLSMIIITMLSVTLFCGFISNAETLKKTVNDYYEKSSLADIVVQFSALSNEDKDFFKTLGAGYEYRIYTEGSCNQVSAKIYSGKNSISKPIIEQGEAGVLIASPTKFDSPYRIGGEIKIEIPNLPAMTFKITGFMLFCEIADANSYMPVYIDEDILDAELKKFSPPLPTSTEILHNQVIIKTDNPKMIKEKITGYYAGLSNSGYIYTFDRDTMEAVVTLNGEVNTSLNMIYVFPVIFLLVSMLVIMTTLSALIMRERTNIGTLKGLGINKRKIMTHYAGFGAVLCFIGGVMGVIAGPLIIPRVMLIKYTLIYSLPAISQIVFSPLWSIAAVLFVSLLAAAIGFLVSFAVMKEKPAECMRPLPPKNNALLAAAAKKGSAKRSRALSLKMAARNIIIKPSRAVMTVAGVTGCVALLVCSFGIGDTVQNSIDLELGGQFYYDISASCTQSSAQDFLTQVEKMKTDGEIKNYETFKTFYMTAIADSVKEIKVISLKEDSAFTSINPKNGALISKSVADELGVKAGDKLKLTSGGNSYEIELTQVIETAVTKGVFITGNGYDENYHTLGIWISAANPQNLLDEINEYSGTRSAKSMTQWRQQVDDTVSSINMIKYTMMIFSIALSVVVLYNLSLLNTKERNRSLATMKVLGFSNFETALSLFLEILILTVLGTGLGLLLGMPILYLVLSINKIEFVAFIYHIKPLSYVFSALLSILTAVVINIIFGRRLKKIDMIDSLKSVE